MENFSIHLVSSASMDVFKNNTLASFRNQLAQPLQLEGKWQVALESIIFPANIKNVTSTLIKEYPKSDLAQFPFNVNDNNIYRRTRDGHPRRITPGVYKNVVGILEEIKIGTKLETFDYVLDPITDKITITFGAGEGISFEDEQIPSVLGFDAPFDDFTNYRHIGFKSNTVLFMQESVINEHTADHPVDITCGTQLLFVYADIIEYQYVGDTKAPILKIIDTERQLKNGSLVSTVPIQKKGFSNLDYKPLLSNNIQNIKIELRTETGKLVPFAGSGKVIINLAFKRIE